MKTRQGILWEKKEWLKMVDEINRAGYKKTNSHGAETDGDFSSVQDSHQKTIMMMMKVYV